ncbi:FecCD family ABC transporter permease [Thermus sediminis]|uniref:FecCD family ABC transporter permease n=1 Tax=Thermus sediminis TaxID=1761908 RepID=UPI001E62D092|nr:iron ABC transporter permease [Thermus sediminis]
MREPVSAGRPYARGLAFLSALLPLAMLLAASQGAYPIPLPELPQALREGGERAAVLWNIRFPRVVLAALVGGGLAMAASALQGVFRTPLVEPGLVGMGGAAALGALLGLALWPSLPWLLPLFAAMGALALAGFLSRLAHREGPVLLLVGVVAGLTLGGVLGVLQFLVEDPQGRSLSFWTLGSFAGASWESAALTAGMLLLSGLALLRLAPFLNALALGEEEAFHLGVPVRALRRWALAWSSLAVGAAVAAGGNVAFVGLLVPWFLRRWVGSDHRFLLPGAFLGGASLAVLADLAARTLFVPAELPVGLLTTVLGGPLFLYLVLGEGRHA